jgi:hypothetical protein
MMINQVGEMQRRLAEVEAIWRRSIRIHRFGMTGTFLSIAMTLIGLDLDWELLYQTGAYLALVPIPFLIYSAILMYRANRLLKRP